MNTQNTILLNRLKDEREQKYNNGIYHWSQLNFAYNSNHMEGNSLTPFQTQTIFDSDAIITENNCSVKVNDIIEIRNHFQAFDFIIDNCKKPLTEDIIKSIHRILQHGTANDIKMGFNIGEYKSLPNFIGGIEEVETCPPEKVHEKMQNLLDRYSSLDHPTLINMIGLHYGMEKIHPFQDGNGRVGRLILYKECLCHDIIPFIIEDKFKEYYLLGMKDFSKNQERLRDTCLYMQDRYTIVCNKLVPNFQNSKTPQ